MKNKLLFFSAVCIFIITGNVEINSQGCNCYPGWQYRMTITITNNNSSAYTNFEVRDSVNTQVLIIGGKMKADCGDIRFTDTLCNPLNYFVESGINTTGTIIWVKVSNLPSSGTRTIWMYYGNPAAVTQSSSNNTFAFYEGFDNNTLGRFGTGPVCSAGTPNTTFTGGVATFSWTSSAIWASDSSYTNTQVFTAEANVTAASGNWPGLYWIRNTGNFHSMAILMGSSNVRISKTPITGGTPYCNGHTFVSPTFPATNPVGIWRFTWISTGSQMASFPSAGTWTTADSEQPRDVPLKIGIGGIAAGSGSYSIDWIRARKYAPAAPVASNGLESSAPAGPGNSLTATVLGSTSIRINWTDIATNEDKYRIERSLNGGASWSLRDSVPANSNQYTDVGLTENTQYCYRVHALNCIGQSANSNAVCSTTTYTGIIQKGNEIPTVFNLYQNFPNPFNPVTIISYELPITSYVELRVFDFLGREVVTLVNEQLKPGIYEVSFDGSKYASGIYFYRIIAGDYVKEMKMVLVK